jgi:hypothetical protein
MIGGGVLAVGAIGAVVATAVVSSGRHPAPAPSDTAAVSTQPLPPEPSFSDVSPPPPANPLDFLSSAGKDTAPLTAETLFPGRKLLRQGRTYTETATARTGSCSAASAGALAPALAEHGCRQVFRATYVRDGVAVTVGVAVFDTRAQADKVKATAQYIRPLNGGGVTGFCHAVACRMTANSVGRYAYFTISGMKNNRSVTAADTAAKQAATDVANVTFQLIVQRGRDEADAAATASPAG